MTTTELLKVLIACDNSIKWSIKYPVVKDAWAACDRAHWLIWFAALCYVDPKTIMRIVCQCIRLTPLDEDSSRALQTVEAWIEGNATPEQLDEAEDQANAAFSLTVSEAACAALAAAQGEIRYLAAYAAEAVDLAAIASQMSYNDAHGKMCQIIRDAIPECPH